MKFIKLLLVIFIVFILFDSVKYVGAFNDYDDNFVSQIRAGGGGTGSGGSGGGGTGTGRIPGGGSGFYCNHHNVLLCVLDYVLLWLLIIVAFFKTFIIRYFKVIRSSINSKKYMKMISDNDITWEYKNIEKQVIDTFYIVQGAWTKMDISLAKEYMDDDLYELFRKKLVWMEVGNKRNVLKRIKLINLKPVSVYDDCDDSKDLVWFYINGSMVDYVINTETREIIEGKNSIIGIPFVEYWKFVRKGDKWVLSKILQSDEKDKIMFQERHK